MSRKVLAPLDMGGQRIVNLGTPSASTDVATRSYVDGAGLGRWRGTWSSTGAHPTDGLGTYAVADIVAYQGTTYRANAVPTVGVVPTNDIKWDILAQAGANGANGTSGVSFTYQGAWVSGTPYLIGQWVSYSNNLYYCNGAVANSSAPPNTDIGWNLAMTGSAASTPVGQVPVVASRNGGWLYPFCMSAGTATATSVTYAHATPLLVPRDTTVDKFGLYILTPATNALWRMGIYADTGSQYPGALVYDAGTTTADTGGWKEITVSPAVSLSTGLYWVVGNPQVAYAAPRGNVGPVIGVVQASSTGDLAAGYIGQLGSGALPSTFPAWGVAGVGNLTNTARVGIRVTA